MASDDVLLECPICSFSVLPSDSYVLRLHFEQEHTEDSPFAIEDDPEPLPPLPPRPSSNRPADVGADSEDQDTPSDSDDENNVLCPEPDCGEIVPLSDFNDHLDLHAAASLSFDETNGEYHSQPPSDDDIDMQPLSHHSNSAARHAHGKQSFLDQNFNGAIPDALRKAEESGRKLKKKVRERVDSTSSEKSTLSRSIAAFNPFIKSNKVVKAPQSTARLGRSELGPYAWEDRMPKWLHQQLADGPKITVVNRIGRDGRLIKQEQVQNETPGIIPVLAQLSALDRSVATAYYCHPSTLHIGKTPREGGFCGYRNIQMLTSYIQGAHAQGYEEFPGRTPGILKLQDLIETAWDKGINSIGRQQTGGIRGTRKYIGTPEAQALFLSSEIDCAVEMFTDSPDGRIEAHEQLLSAIESYFSQAAIKADGSKVYKTLLPPIYLQQPGHSVTIVGFERRKEGACNLVVLDPMYHTSPAMHALLGRRHIKSPRPEILQAYRRGARQLGKYAAYEVLMLTALPPLFPAWDVLRQFPDVRYLYAFFRSMTLGYDVYPEDHFLRNFPWYQYGELWIVDDARFARAEKLNPLIAQALRQITGEGAPSLTPTSSTGSAGSSGSGSINQSMAQVSTHINNIHSAASSRATSLISSFDSAHVSGQNDTDTSPIDPVLNMIGMHVQQSPVAKGQKPGLYVKIPQRKNNPGYPTLVSPTSGAMQLYPSPTTKDSNGLITPLIGSPISIESPDMCGSSRYHKSPGFDRNIVQPTSHNKPINSDCTVDSRCSTTLSGQNIEYIGQAKVGGMSLAFPPCPTSPATTISSTSPQRTKSPRNAMLKSMFGKQAFHNMSHTPPSCTAGYATGDSSIFSGEFTNLTTGLNSSSPSSPLNSPTHSDPALIPSASPPLWIEIANGTETSTVSPISPTGTVLRYTSQRPVDSGLLAMRPLSEAQVAEYRFWRPCGRRSCAFGCGDGNQGETAAARRLFKSEEQVVPEEENREGEEREGEGKEAFAHDGRCDPVYAVSKPNKRVGAFQR